MKLYEDSRAPNPRRVRIFLAEKGVEIPRIQLDIMAQEHCAPEMTELNPLTRVPFLVLDDGTVIAETVAICRYFEALQPAPSLMGETAEEQGMVEMWQRRVEQCLFMPVSQCFRHQHPRMALLEQPQIREWGEANKPKAEWMLDLLDAELATRNFIAGERFSIADITALCTIDFMKVARIALKDGHDNIRRWHAEISARPSAAA